MAAAVPATGTPGNDPSALDSKHGPSRPRHGAPRAAAAKATSSTEPTAATGKTAAADPYADQK
jgi:hypothetical protein